ncbi:MAG: aldehyde dehydrogenase family protein [Nitrospinae bacterium]|nr:aldehyde dehydrogenase family protein [Nitrospinota bacterium]
MGKHYKLFISGEWRGSSQEMEVLNPYNGEVVGVVSQGEKGDINNAIDSAVLAFENTRRLPAYRRAEILEKISKGIEERGGEIATTITLESGKPITDSMIEVKRAINTFKIGAEEAKRIYGELIPLDLMSGSEGRLAITRRFPIGPILGISPFNFPLNLVAHKIAPAIASGNPIILKPASKTPITALILGEIIEGAGIGHGGVNIIPCPSPLAEEIVIDERIKMLTFTGSTDVGWYLKEKANKKKVILELGGNAGVIVHSDGDIDYAVKRCITGSFSYSGQICISVQRIYVEEGIYEEFIDRFISQIKGLKIGDPMDETTNIGPMLDLPSAERLERWIKEATEDGARVMVGGNRDGTLFEPTVVTDTKPYMKINCQEVFGPVVTITPYNDFKEAINMVNDSIFGLQAGVFTRDIQNIFYAFDELDVGGLIINDVPIYRIDHMPYGGVKESGIGREGIRYAIEEMTELKLMALRW